MKVPKSVLLESKNWHPRSRKQTYRMIVLKTLMDCCLAHVLDLSIGYVWAHGYITLCLIQSVYQYLFPGPLSRLHDMTLIFSRAYLNAGTIHMHTGARVCLRSFVVHRSLHATASPVTNRLDLGIINRHTPWIFRQASGDRH